MQTSSTQGQIYILTLGAIEPLTKRHSLCNTQLSKMTIHTLMLWGVYAFTWILYNETAFSAASSPQGFYCNLGLKSNDLIQVAQKNPMYIHWIYIADKKKKKKALGIFRSITIKWPVNQDTIWMYGHVTEAIVTETRVLWPWRQQRDPGKLGIDVCFQGHGDVRCQVDCRLWSRVSVWWPKYHNSAGIFAAGFFLVTLRTAIWEANRRCLQDRFVLKRHEECVGDAAQSSWIFSHRTHYYT